MVSFKDGPAGGQSLALRRAPMYLRVVMGPRGKLDALDQVEDTPAENETVHVYVRNPAGPVGMVHMRPGGCYQMGEYWHVPDAPASELRDTAAWQAWAQAQPEAAPR